MERGTGLGEQVRRMAETPGRHERDGLIPLTVAADRLGVSVKTVRRWITYGLLDGYRVGPKAIRVDAAAVAHLARRLPDGEGDTG